MKKSLIIVAVIALVIVGTAGFMLGKKTDKPNQAGQSETDHGHEESGADPHDLPQVDLTRQNEVSIDIKDYAYSQPNIKIKKGTKVTWTNRDAMEHNAMREHDGKEHAHSAPAKNEVKDTLFAGPLLKRGESYSFTFNDVESLTYHCAPHPYMQGAITVVE